MNRIAFWRAKGWLRQLFQIPSHPVDRKSRRLHFDALEARVTPAVPSVLSVSRAGPSAEFSTNTTSVDYAVTFDSAVSNVDDGDFRVTTTGTLTVANPLNVTPTGPSTFNVTLDGVSGSGTLRLDLVDDDSITNADGPLGGPGLGIGTFQGQSYQILQASPFVVSILPTNPAGPTTSQPAVSYTVTFNKDVLGVDDSDFALSLVGTTANPQVAVTLVSDSVYVVTIDGIAGNGTLGLELIDDGSITDFAGNPLIAANAAASLNLSSSTPANTPFALAVGDVDGDGIADLVTVDYGNSTAMILPTNGTAIAYPVGNSPRSVALGDFDGDGILDVAAANFGDRTVSVLRGNGDGTFQPQSLTPVGASPSSVAIADVNGDGKPDLLAANYGDGNVSILRNDNAGGFLAEQTVAVGANPFALVLGDLDGDGDTDFAVSNYLNDTVTVLLNDGTGNFVDQPTLATGDYPASLAIGDANGDQIADLLVANSRGDSVGLILGNGNGTFGPQQAFPVGNNPFTAVFADMNRDGFLDVVTADFNGGAVSVLLGDGAGNFGPKTTFSTDGSAPLAIAVTDFNGDGFADLAVSNYTGNSIAVLLGSGSAGDASGDPYTIVESTPAVTAIDRGTPATVSTDATTVVFAVHFDTPVTDVDESDFRVVVDGTLQLIGTLIVTGSDQDYTVTLDGLRGSGQVRLELVDDDSIVDGNLIALGGDGVGNGSFVGQAYTIAQNAPSVVSIARTTPTGPATNATSVIFTVTFNEPVTGVDDGDFSLVATGVTFANFVVARIDDATYTVTVSGITGDGTLGLDLVDDGTIVDFGGIPLSASGTPAVFDPPATFDAPTQPFALAMIDLNGDGFVDLVVGSYDTASITVLLGDGIGGFQTALTFLTGDIPRSIAVGDFNGDGNDDLAIAAFGSNTVTVLLGNGNGSFQPARSFAVGLNPSGVAVGDLDGDGTLDLAVANMGNGTVSLLMGNGDGTFRPATTELVGDSPAAVVLGDLDGDGRLDLVVSNYDDAIVSVLLGNGDGTFQTRQTFAVGDQPTGLAVADVDGDGDLDIVVANRLDDTVSVLLGDGTGAFPVRQTLAAGPGPVSVVVGDVNGDGSADLAVSHYVGTTAGVFLGDGAGDFGPVQEFDASSAPLAIVLGDVDGDGLADLVVSNLDRARVSVLLGRATPGDSVGEIYAIDQTAPTVTAIFSGTSGANDFFTSNGSLTLTPDDSGSGVASVSYTLDGGASTPYTGPIAITGDGQHTVVATIIDVARNTVTISFPVAIDTVPPDIVRVYDGTPGSNGYFTSTGDFTLTATDSTSGVASLEYQLDNGPLTTFTAPFAITGDGAHTVIVTATDNAGLAVSQTFTVMIDTVAPTLSGSFDGTAGTNGFFTSNGRFTLDVSDATSGVASVTYRLDGGPITPYTAPFAIIGDGTHNVIATVTDNAGLVTTQTFTVTIDSIAPTVTIGTPNPTVVTPPGSATFLVTFSDSNFDLATLTSADVNLIANGPVTANIGISGSGAIRTVTLSNITGFGTIAISIKAGAARDLAGYLSAASAVSATVRSLNPPDVVLTGTQDANTIIVFRTSGGGLGDISYILNGAAPVPLTGVNSFRFIGGSDADSMTVNMTATGRLVPGDVSFDGMAGQNSLTLDANGQTAYVVASQLFAGTQPVPYEDTSSTRILNALVINGIAGPNTAQRDAAFVGLTPDQRFVQALYLAELGRAGSVAELNPWVESITANGSLEPIAMAISDSDEAHTRLVGVWYRAYLNRAVVGAEAAPWVEALKTQTEEQVLAGILASSEYLARALTLIPTGTDDERFVASLYQNFLNRSGTSTEIAAWIARLPSLGGRSGLAAAFLATDEFRFNLIHSYYVSALLRPGDAAGVASWFTRGLDALDTRIGFRRDEFYFNG